MEVGSILRRGAAAWAACALLLLGAAPRTAKAQRPAIPPIDAAAPAKTVTATFGLG